MEGRVVTNFLCIFLACIVPALQQGFSPGNNAMQPSWQPQPVANPQPQTWGNNQQQQQQQQPQAAQPWGASQSNTGGPAQQQSWNNQQAQPQQPQQAPTSQGSTNKGSGVGVRMLSIRAGDAKTFPSMGQNVTVHYTGTLQSNGKEFDSSVTRGEPFTFTLGVGQVIRGWDIAVAHLTLGQKARFTVGPEYAYGPEGIPGSIPPNAILKFDIELLSIS